jgi:hypothetical protein
MQAHTLHHDLQRCMRRFGRQCRGHGKVLVTVVRQTEQQLLQLGNSITTLAQAAQHSLQRATQCAERQRDRLARQLQAAVEAHHAISAQSRRLTQGKRLHHCKIVNAYDGTIAPILKGKSNCPTQFGRKPGLLSEPTTGFIFATRVPAGNPSDPSYVLPMIEKVQRAIDRVSLPRRLAIHSVAGDLGVNDAALREARHARGILTVGIPQTMAPLPPSPTQEEVRQSLIAAGLRRTRTPHQVHLAFACGYSRPVVESHIASLLARGAGHIRYKGLQGAVVQMGMTVIAHNGAAMVRIRHLQLSKRAQKFRRLLGLRHRKINQINGSKN